MCGIFGLLNYDNHQNLDFLKSSHDFLSKRGPDEFSFTELHKNLLFGHARLSISGKEFGKQPMKSFCGRYHVVFNGEIYNHEYLKKSLLKKITSQRIMDLSSDTRVFVEFLSLHGIEETIKKHAEGSFVVAIYDYLEKKITIANDNFAEKPLYYSLGNKHFIFCSRLLPISKYLKINPDIESLNSSLLKVRNIFPNTIFNGVKRLGPGQLIEIDSKLSFKTKNYIHNSFNKKENKNNSNSFKSKNRPFKKNLDYFEEIFSETIKEMIPKDQKVSALLSGGIDSSLVSIYLAKNLSCLETFTVSFPDQEYDESIYAREVATHIRSKHNEYKIFPSDLIEIMDNYTDIIDEPFGDSSLVPSTFIFKKIKSKGFKITFSGDGGDELFYGYERYRYLRMSLWMDKFPVFLRKSAAAILEKVISIKYVNLSPNIRYKLKKAIDNGFHLMTSREIYNLLIQQNSNLNIFSNRLDNSKNINSIFSSLHQSEMHFFRTSDIANYMYEDTLVKTDSASMASSIESRLPFLHPKIASFALGLDYKVHMHNFKTKSILKYLLQSHLGKEFITRPKKGFSLPLDKWLRESLNSWMKDNIDAAKSIIQSEEMITYLDELIISLESGDRVSDALWPFISLGCWYKCIKK
ncbi:asparagine synthase (glutamine-hydrolyzing) [Prochlorococcus marinus]|uniref:asparagine synthase (glutamine-hydrolyzing) n=1 Tax=Prochlorococcus marinus TaxID=1219 RepID=UPI001ADD1F90|nr:asparagine synthase (glutamine-hydrolyzing) [Prochlorococcus marinus]MBO8219547.1 asparagine synthase (glutamine-hydrolyzing) [Prochlorococcus marinus CUG1416]MBW3051918.1 asparagine synthase (glutamine-hydrolyzing) [Prochlorococcus marinus str. MU1416]